MVKDIIDDVNRLIDLKLKFTKTKTPTERTNLKRQVDALANALANLGIKKRDKVVVFLPTCPQFIISDFAILKTGATLVPSSPLLKAPTSPSVLRPPSGNTMYE